MTQTLGMTVSDFMAGVRGQIQMIANEFGEAEAKAEIERELNNLCCELEERLDELHAVSGEEDAEAESDGSLPEDEVSPVCETCGEFRWDCDCP